MLSSNPFYYLPLLETKSGSVAISNLSFNTFNGYTPSVADAINSGALALGQPATDSSIAPHFSFDTSSGALKYDGGSWGNSGGGIYNLEVLCSDMAWFSGSKQADLFVPVSILSSTPSPDIVYHGGTGVLMRIYALVNPVIDSISPTSFPDTSGGTVTIKLKQQLHESQNPTLSVAVTGGATIGTINLTYSPTDNPGTPSQGITGWAFPISSPSPGSVTLTATLTDPQLQYLEGPAIVTKSVTYWSGQPLGTITFNGTSTFTISQPSIAAASSGFIGSITGNTAYAGRITISATVTASNPSDLTNASVSVVARDNSSNTSFNLPNMTSAGNTVSSGGLYQKNFSLTFDSSSLLNSSASYEIGVSATSTSGGNKTSVLWYAATLLNRNISSDFSTWAIYTLTSFETDTSYIGGNVYVNSGFVGPTTWLTAPDTGTLSISSPTSVQAGSIFPGRVKPGTIIVPPPGTIAPTPEPIETPPDTFLVKDNWGQQIVSDPNLENVSNVEISFGGASPVPVAWWARGATATPYLYVGLPNSQEGLTGLIQVALTITTKDGKVITTPTVTFFYVRDIVSAHSQIIFDDAFNFTRFPVN